MADCFTIVRGEFQIAAGLKVLKARDYRARLAAAEFIAAARREAERVTAEAEREYQAAVEKSRHMRKEMDIAYQDARQQGYEAGFASAQNDYAVKINRALIDRAAIIDQAKQSLVDMVLESLKAILGDIGADRTLRGIAAKALRKASREQTVKLRVHPDRIEDIQGVVNIAMEKSEGPEWIDVVADANLGLDDCLLQTPAGILDFSLDTQLRVLQEGLSERLQKAGAP